MRTRIISSLFIGLIAFGALASSAHALVPGWSRSERRTRVYASACAIQAVQAIQSVTGVAPTKVMFDAFTYEIRGFTSTGGIFAYCTTSPAALCPNRPAANLILLGISDVSGADASSLRSAVDTAFGNPQLFDCN